MAELYANYDAIDGASNVLDRDWGEYALRDYLVALRQQQAQDLVDLSDREKTVLANRAQDDAAWAMESGWVSSPQVPDEMHPRAWSTESFTAKESATAQQQVRHGLGYTALAA